MYKYMAYSAPPTMQHTLLSWRKRCLLTVPSPPNIKSVNTSTRTTWTIGNLRCVVFSAVRSGEVNAVRQLQLHVAAFGDPNDIYCHPARQNPYGLSLTTNPKTLLIGATLPALSPLPLPTTPFPQCNSCGHRDHVFKNCPHMWLVDSNTNHNVPWDHSNMGRTWAQYGHATYPLHDRIPGLGRFKIQIPRRETNFTDEVLNNNPPPGGAIRKSTKGTPIMGETLTGAAPTNRGTARVVSTPRLPTTPPSTQPAVAYHSQPHTMVRYSIPLRWMHW